MDHEKRTEVRLMWIQYVLYQEDQEAVRKEMKKRYDMTHDYNPLTATFYDNKKEEEFQEYIKSDLF